MYLVLWEILTGIDSLKRCYHLCLVWEVADCGVLDAQAQVGERKTRQRVRTVSGLLIEAPLVNSKLDHCMSLFV